MSHHNDHQLGQTTTYTLNTSNPNKLKEFRRLFTAQGIQLKVSDKNIREIVADPMTVVVHKASQLPPRTIVEDTSLEVKGAEVGINIKWLLEHLNDFLGRKAIWEVLLAYRSDDGKVHVYQGKVEGILVAPRGEGFGFDPFFQPAGSTQTLAEWKPDLYNARAKAVATFAQGEAIAVEEPIIEWEGDWQEN